ncbi:MULTISPECIES: YqeG family HAD IIIA-type phosphatase [Bacillaceae]|uniref:YqeG family HAD IIIA-type phosphatase n=1 Tax=Evansella alkalicola TaxID=745819 RepID=A0ABS6JNN1_9BACI|nr:MULTISPECIES: YqeG family HAD IIIA-type phosphatase [Bacillaceae]MBU9720155.1 YqeG family HAD IIIA-type phosphatase [Bacillus alkalicola]
MKYFKPDYLFEHFTDITITWLKEHQIQHIFSDLDSTLAAHDQLGCERFENWLAMLHDNHIELVIISNNNQERVDKFTEPFGITGYGKANKPTTTKIEKIMKDVGAKSETSIFLGDQIFTDVLCGKRLGMTTVLVQPIGPEHEPWNITIKRKLETVIRSQW